MFSFKSVEMKSSDNKNCSTSRIPCGRRRKRPGKSFSRPTDVSLSLSCAALTIILISFFQRNDAWTSLHAQQRQQRCSAWEKYRGECQSLLPLYRLFSTTPQSQSTSSSSTSDEWKNGRHKKQRQSPSQYRQKNGNKRKLYSIRNMFRTAKTMERQGRWGEALSLFEQILEKDPQDAHSHLALARLEARREQKQATKPSSVQSTQEQVGDARTAQVAKTKAEIAFEAGTAACPESVHLWQAWAIYEQGRDNMDRARDLFQVALTLEPNNPYVCHAFSLMEKKLGHDKNAVALLEKAMHADNATVTAALVCTLGELHIGSGKLVEARNLYATNLPHLQTEKDRVEVYLAAAWLEERHFRNLSKAQKLLQQALAISPTSSLASVALARLEGRIQAAAESASATTSSGRSQRARQSVAATKATAKRLAIICDEMHKNGRKNFRQQQRHYADLSNFSSDQAIATEDGRVFNALASLEIKQRRFNAARDVLRKGIELCPLDHNLFTAAGKVEERVGNYTWARHFYSESLRLEPSAPTLVAFALLELDHPEFSTSFVTKSEGGNKQQANFTLIKGLFEEALLLDPRNGPAYNAYGNAEARHGNLEEARSIFQRGVQANCSDAASIYHGYGMLELSCGNVEQARSILYEGLESVRQNQDLILSDIPHRDRAKFLSHTLGMLELNSNRPTVALRIFQEGIERCGNSSRLLLGSALCEMRLGKDDAARRLFERSIVTDPKQAEAWQAWGVMETRAGHFRRASAIFQKGIKHAPKHGSLWHGYAALELKRGKIMNARTLFAAGLKKATRRHYALFQGWALLELREGNYEAARKLISEALTRNKKNGRGWIIAAQIEKQEGRSGLVSLLLRRGIECDPNNAELYRELGEYLVGQGKINDAREVFEKGMEMNPMYAPLYHSMAELEARICNLGALAELNKRTAKLFNGNALEPSTLSYEAFGSRFRSQHYQQQQPDHLDDHHVSGHGGFGSSRKSVSALATKIVLDDDVNDDDGNNAMIMGLVGDEVDPFSVLESMNGDGLVGDMMNIETMVSDDPQ